MFSSRLIELSLFIAVTSAPALAQGATTQKSLVANDKVRVTTVDIPAGRNVSVDRDHDALFVKIADFGTVHAEAPRKANSWAKDAVQYAAAGWEKPQDKNATSDATYVQVRFARPQGKYVAFEVPVTHYCNPGTRTACVNEQYLFCTERFCVEAVTLGAGAASTQHSHTGDHIVIAIQDFTWREELPGGRSVEQKFKAGDAMYIKAGVTHRLINGKTPARLVMVQFK